jgi:hypothetical protein
LDIVEESSVMESSWFRHFFRRPSQPSRRRRTYHLDDYGKIPDLIADLQKDETRDGRVEETPLQALMSKVTSQPPRRGRERHGTRRVGQLIGQLKTDRPMKQTGGVTLTPVMLFEGGLSLMVLAFLITFFVRDLSAFVKF